MSLSGGDLVDDVERLLRAGFEEMTEAAKAEYEPFVRDFAPLIAGLGVRAEIGDEAAVLSLRMLKEQALTHAAIVKLKAAGESNVTIQNIVGIAIRVVLGALA